MNEKEFIEKLKKLDPQAIKELVETFQVRVINICYRFLQNREDAEDTAQEVFIEFFRSIERFRRQSKLSTWIYQIAVSKSLDQIRKKTRKKRMAGIQNILLKNGQAEMKLRSESESSFVPLDAALSSVSQKVKTLYDSVE